MNLKDVVDFNTPFDRLLEVAATPLPADAQGQVLSTAKRGPLEEEEIQSLLAPMPYCNIYLGENNTDGDAKLLHIDQQLAARPHVYSQLEVTEEFINLLRSANSFMAYKQGHEYDGTQVKISPTALAQEYSLTQPLGHRMIGPMIPAVGLMLQPSKHEYSYLFKVGAQDEILHCQLHEIMHLRQLTMHLDFERPVHKPLRELDAENGALLAFQIGCEGSPALAARRILQRTFDVGYNLASPSHTYWHGATAREMDMGGYLGGLVFLTGIYNAAHQSAPDISLMQSWARLNSSNRMLSADPALGPEHGRMLEIFRSLAELPEEGRGGRVARGMKQHVERPKIALPAPAEVLIRKCVAAAKVLRPDWF